MNTHSLAGQLERLQNKQDQSFTNARRVNSQCASLYMTSRRWRRFRKWMHDGQRWQDRTINALLTR